MLFPFPQKESVQSLQFWLPRIIFFICTIIFPSLGLSIAATFLRLPSPFFNLFLLFLFDEHFISPVFCICNQIVIRKETNFSIPKFYFSTSIISVVWSVLQSPTNICTLYLLTLPLILFFITDFRATLFFNLPLAMIKISLLNR